MLYFYQKIFKVFLLIGNLFFLILGQTGQLKIVQNLISNGNFSENECSLFRCISSDINMVKDWIPDPELELGYASAFTDHFESRTQRIIELTPNKDSCIKQRISPVLPGYYKLTIESVARRDFPLSSAKFTVSLNGSWLRTVTPTDYKPHFETFDVEVRNTCEAELKLCGIRKGTRKDGAVIKSVKMVTSSLAEQEYASIPVLFCRFEPTESGIFLRSLTNSFFEKKHNFKSNEYTMSFDFKVVASAVLAQSEIVVKIDGLEIHRVPVSESGKNIVIKLQNISVGEHSISFHESASQNDPEHVYKITNVIFKSEVCLSKWTENLIINGGFENTTCDTLQFCLYKKWDFIESNLPGWLPDPFVEVATGKSCNPKFNTTTKVTESDAFCFKQMLKLKPGKHILRFERAAKYNQSLTGQSYEIKLDNQVIKKEILTNYEVEREGVELDLTSVPNQSEFKICGLNTGQTYGVLFDNVELIYLDTCSEIQSLQSPSFPSDIIDVDTLLINDSDVIEISSDLGRCSSVKYNLIGGDLEINFDFLVTSPTIGVSSGLVVHFDNQIIKPVSVKESGNLINSTISNVINGSHTLEFCSFQNPKEQFHTMQVKNLVLRETRCLPKWTENLIINGNFEQAVCIENSCLYNQSNWQQSLLPGWINYLDEIEVGRGSFYNSRMGDTKVINLDATKNTCILQKLFLKVGKYFLSFVTATQVLNVTAPLTSFGLEVRMNGRTLKKVTHLNSDTSLEKIEFTLDYVLPEGNSLEFCGMGIGDGFGSLIDDVKLFFLDECFKNEIFVHKF